MKMKKCFVWLVVSALLLVTVPTGVFTVTAWAEEFYFSVSDGEATLTGVNRELMEGEVEIPATYEDHPVTAIGAGAFSSCENITGVHIPDTVTSIGDEAFGSCTSLAAVTIPANVANIGEKAFAWCTSLESITVAKENPIYHSDGNCVIHTESKTVVEGCNYSSIPKDGTVTRIGDLAFNGRTALVEITIPYGVTDIGIGSFSWCTSLTSVMIPRTVNTIGEFAFLACSNLSALEVEEGNAEYHSTDNCLIHTANKTLIAGCQNSVIPHDDSVTSISSYAFANCGALTRIEIPSNITDIGMSAFSGCNNLAQITVADSIMSIEVNAFAETGYYNDPSNWENNVLYIGKHLIEANRELSGTYEVKEGTLTLAAEAFQFCWSLTGIVLPRSLRHMSRDAMSLCMGLESITVDEGNEIYHSVGNCLVRTGDKTLVLGCKNSVIPDDGSVTQIGEGAFWGCNITRLGPMPETITGIGHWAFAYCEELTQVAISDTVTLIEEGAFFECIALTDVYYQGTEEDRANIVIESENDAFLNAAWHYNVCYHSYDHACDVDCNTCGEVRETVHIYDNEEDTICSVCGYTRENMVIVGNVDGSDKVDSTDARLVLQYAVKKIDASALNVAAADVDGNGKVDSTDARLILQYAVKKIDKFPAA